MHAIQSNLVQTKILTATFVNFLVTAMLSQEFNFTNQVSLFMYWYLSFLVTGQTKMVMKDQSRKWHSLSRWIFSEGIVRELLTQLFLLMFMYFAIIPDASTFSVLVWFKAA